MSPVILEFRNLPEQFERTEYQQLFSKFGTIKKLYIDPEGTFGKVYFETIEEATAAFRELHNKQPLHLSLIEPTIRDFSNRNTAPNMNRPSYHNKYYDYDVDGHISKFQFVDVFGRLVSTIEDDDGEIYVSLTELKKSGFELYQAGTLPKPGQSKHFDDQLLNQFEMYMKMKAAKFISVHKFNISQDGVNNVMNKEVNQHFSRKGAERSVKIDSTGLLKISATPLLNDPPSLPQSNRSRMSLDIDEINSLGGGNRLRQASNFQSAGRLTDKWNQRNNGESNSRFSGRSGYSDDYANQRTRLSKENNNTNSFTKGNNNWNQRTSSVTDDDNFKKPLRGGFSSDQRSNRQTNYGTSRDEGNRFGTMDNDDNHSVASSDHGISSNETKPLARACLNMNTPQKVTVVHIESESVAWVHLISNMDIIENIYTETAVKAENSKSIIPKVNMICAAEYDDVWYRAIVLSTKPLKVLYIDFGNESDTISEIRGLPNEVCAIPGQAIRIKLISQSSKLTNDNDLVIDVISQEPDLTYNVLIKKSDEFESKPPEGITIKSEPYSEETNGVAASHTKNDSNIGTTKRVSFVEAKIEDLSSKKPSQHIAELNSTNRNNTKSVPQAEIDTAIAAVVVSTSPLDIDIPLSARKSVAELCTSGKGVLDCTEKLTDSTFIAFLFPEQFQSQIVELETITQDSKDDSNFKPNIGDFVAVVYNGEYVRGTVINKTDDKYVCALVDYGIIITTNEVRSLPDKYKDIPEFTCLCKCDSKVLSEINMAITYNISITNAPSEQSANIQLTDKGLEVTASRWNPFKTSTLASSKQNEVPEEPVIEKQSESVVVQKPIAETIGPVYTLRPPVHKLKDNDLVIIVAEQQGHLLLRTKECNQVLKQVTQGLLNYKGQPFDKPPEIGQLVIASFSDDGFYRATIRSVENNNVTIEYIDYGNSNSVPLKKLYSISEQLAQIDNTLIKVDLKDFNNTKFSDKVLRMLEDCSVRKEKFTVVPTGSSNEYDLISADKTSLSEKLKIVNNPTPPKLQPVPRPTTPKKDIPKPIKTPPPVPSVVKVSNLPRSKIKLGVNKVICMYTGNLTNGNASFCLSAPETSDLLTEVNDKILECVSKSLEPYTPQCEEICLAKFADAWYRAQVIEPIDDGYNVMYIDYGNSHVVTVNDICKIPNELTKMEPLASLCILKGVVQGDAIPDLLLLKMQSEIQENEEYSINVIDDVEGFLIITIPSLYEAWKKEGLL